MIGPAKLRELVFVLGAVAALSFLAARFVDAPGLIEPIWKAAGIVLLGLSAALSGAILAAVALLASSSGDFFLELSPPLWIAGMTSFALAHVFFIAAFAARIRKDGLRIRNWPFVVAVILSSAVMLFWFLPDMGELRVPGIAYHLVLTTMVVVSLLAPVSPLGPIGAVAFLTSDTLIALGLYKEMGPFPIAIWVTYAAAQAMLAWALSRRLAK